MVEADNHRWVESGCQLQARRGETRDAACHGYIEKCAPVPLTICPVETNVFSDQIKGRSLQGRTGRA
jgi:hypothetical protein